MFTASLLDKNKYIVRIDQFSASLAGIPVALSDWACFSFLNVL